MNFPSFRPKPEHYVVDPLDHINRQFQTRRRRAAPLIGQRSSSPITLTGCRRQPYTRTEGLLNISNSMPASSTQLRSPRAARCSVVRMSPESVMPTPAITALLKADSLWQNYKAENQNNEFVAQSSAQPTSMFYRAALRTQDHGRWATNSQARFVQMTQAIGWAQEECRKAAAVGILNRTYNNAVELVRVICWPIPQHIRLPRSATPQSDNDCPQVWRTVPRSLRRIQAQKAIGANRQSHHRLHQSTFLIVTAHILIPFRFGKWLDGRSKRNGSVSNWLLRSFQSRSHMCDQERGVVAR
jgi:hypothetical protein